MTTTYHTAIATGAAANASTFNTPLSALDTQLTATQAAAAATTAEVVASRDAYGTLDARLDAMVFAGGNVATLTNGAADAGQTTVTVDSTTGFIAGAYVAYVLVGGALEYNTIDSITPTTTLTLGTNVGAGGIANDTYISMISPSEYQAAQAINHAGSLTLPQAMEYAAGGVFNVEAYGASTSASAAANSIAIQAAIDAATSTGGEVVFPPGMFKISTALSVLQKRGLRIRGAMQSYANPGSGLGTTIQWDGAVSQNMLYVFNSQDIRVDGICFEGGEIAGSRAIFVNSDNVQVSKRIHIDHCSFRLLSIGIQFAEDDHLAQHQVDSDYITNCAWSEMYGDNSTCVHVQSQNVDLLNIENCEMAQADFGLRLVRSGIVRMCNVSAGTGGVFVSVEGPVQSLNLTNCQAEAITSWLHVTSTAPGTLHPIILQSCTVDCPIQIDATTRLVSIASIIGADVTLAANDCEFASIFDAWNSGAVVVKEGEACRDFYLTGDGLQLNSLSTTLKTILGATATWEPGVMETSTIAVKQVAVTGAVEGDTVLVAHTAVNAVGLFLTGTVVSAGQVFVTLLNVSGEQKTIASGTLRVTVIKQ